MNPVIFTQTEQNTLRRKMRILVIGAGDSALEFIRTYRAMNQHDQFTVFLSESQKRHLRRRNRIENQPAVTLYDSNPVYFIDTGRKTVIDSFGREHCWDRIVLVTGHDSAQMAQLAERCGIHLQEDNKIAVNQNFQTTLPNIFAVGEGVKVRGSHSLAGLETARDCASRVLQSCAA